MNRRFRQAPEEPSRNTTTTQRASSEPPHSPTWRIAKALIPVALLSFGNAAAEVRDPTLTFYVAEVSGEEGWEDVMVNPVLCDYVDSYLAVTALSGTYATYHADRLHLEAEGQVGYNFGGQHHWEFNVVPVLARWYWPAWRGAYTTSAAFGLGLSYASDLPPVEVELEGESEKLLMYWVVELTAGPMDAPWAVSLRLHHRSVAYGLLGTEGGMNGVGLGLRYKF
jgi:hypothetical protein